MKMIGLSIDFPVIVGKSDRQVEYAENLREVYVTKHENRFREIEKIVSEECDYRIKNGFDNGATSTFFEDFTNVEKACLFGTDAGGIIATLKSELELERD